MVIWLDGAASLISWRLKKSLCPPETKSCVNHEEKGFTWCSFADFQVLNPGLPTALAGVLNWHGRAYCTIPASLMRFFCSRMYRSRVFIRACKIFLCLAGALHFLGTRCTAPCTMWPNLIPQTLPSLKRFKYWLSPNGSEARTKQSFAGNGCGSGQFLLHLMTLNSLLKMYSFCDALMLERDLEKGFVLKS